MCQPWWRPQRDPHALDWQFHYEDKCGGELPDAAWGPTRAGLYTRVSTVEQSPAAQIEALREYAAARGWEAVEHIDHGVSGAKQRRPALDTLLAAALRREVAVVVVTKLDRLARSLHHPVALERTTW